MATKTCPRCAERIKAAALVCRYCGHEMTLDEDMEATGGNSRWSRKAVLWAVLAFIAFCTVAFGIGVAISPSTNGQQPIKAVERSSEKRPADAGAPPSMPPELALGTEIEWSADKQPAEILRQVGNMTIRIRKREDDDLFAPELTVTMGSESVTVTGEFASDVYTHSIAAFSNAPGAPQAILLQSYSGGAHCCTQITMIEAAAGRLRTIDLGSWDGDQGGVPTDRSGDGVPDFVMADNAFLYAFTSYSHSMAPRKILNVVSGRVVDVSGRPAFAHLHEEDLAAMRRTCIDGEDGHTRNGACAGYVAQAARAGSLQTAWNEMLASYDSSQDWQYPQGCAVKADRCPEDRLIDYPNYPEALLAFLKDRGYVRPDWTPARGADIIASDESET